MLSVSQRSVRGRGVWVQGLVGEEVVEVEGLVVRVVVVVVVVGGFGAVVLVGLLVDSPPERVVTILEVVVFDATEGKVSGVCEKRGV